MLSRAFMDYSESADCAACCKVAGLADLEEQACIYDLMR